jgi:hypothetical protein
LSEEWRPVVGWEGFYEVSSLGRVKSLSRQAPHYRGGTSLIPESILKPDTSSYYLRVTLFRGERKERPSIHRMVCESFNGPPPYGKPWVLHRDGNPRNNLPENLYWGTPKQNMEDKKRHGRNHELNKTHCPQGHPYSGENLYVVPRSGKRQCRKCTTYRGLRDRDKHNKSRREKRRKDRGE